MTLYTNLTSREIAEFAKTYSIGKVRNYYPMKRGYTNSNYFIQTNHQKYILTICEDKTPQQTRTLMNLLNHLHQHLFQSNQVIASKNDEYVLQYNDKPVYMKKFLEGEVVEKPTVQFIEHLGTRIAQLHNIKIPDDITTAFPYGLSYFAEITSIDLDHPYIEWLKTKSNYLHKSIPDQLPTGLVHGDIFPDNIIQKDGNLGAIIDFEEVSNYPFIFDLGMATTGIFADYNVIDLCFPKALVKGYQKVRMLEPLEKELLKLFTFYGAVATSFWRFRQFHIRFPTPEKSTHHQYMVDIADKLYEMDNNKFMGGVFL